VRSSSHLELRHSKANRQSWGAVPRIVLRAKGAADRGDVPARTAGNVPARNRRLFHGAHQQRGHGDRVEHPERRAALRRADGVSLGAFPPHVPACTRLFIEAVFVAVALGLGLACLSAAAAFPLRDSQMIWADRSCLPCPAATTILPTCSAASQSRQLQLGQAVPFRPRLAVDAGAARLDQGLSPVCRVIRATVAAIGHWYRASTRVARRQVRSCA